MAARRARVLREQGAGDHQQTLRRHLIGVTQHLLAAHGLAGLTTRAIAREAQVSDGVLYNHFADKDDLVVSALSERIVELSQAAVRRCPRPGEQDLRAGLTALVDACVDLQTAVLPLVGGLMGRPELVQALLQRMHGEGSPRLLWQALDEYVAGEQRLGAVAPDVDTRAVGEVLFGVSQMYALGGALLSSGDDAGRPLRPHDRDRMVIFLLRACAAPGAPG